MLSVFAYTVYTTLRPSDVSRLTRSVGSFSPFSVLVRLRVVGYGVTLWSYYFCALGRRLNGTGILIPFVGWFVNGVRQKRTPHSALEGKDNNVNNGVEVLADG